MRKIAIILGVFLWSSCKEETSDSIKYDTYIDKVGVSGFQEYHSKILNVEFEKRVNILNPTNKKTINVVAKRPDNQDDLIIKKQFIKKTDVYELNFNYPYLNEDINWSYRAFNDFIENKYINTYIESFIFEEKGKLYLEKPKSKMLRNKEVINFKVYNAKNDLLSLVIYKEVYYAGDSTPLFTFETLNFDLEKSGFLDYNHFFQNGSERDVLTKINEVINRNIQNGCMYYDCWNISERDFELYKNNFVINDTNIEYYFGYYIMCPLYTGQYSVEIPIWELKELLKSFEFYEPNIL